MLLKRTRVEGGAPQGSDPPPPPRGEVLEWPCTVGRAPPKPPPLQTKVANVGKNEIYHWENLVRFWYTHFWNPSPQTPSSLLILNPLLSSNTEPPPPRDREQQGPAWQLRAGQDPGASPPLREQGPQGAAGRAGLQAQGQPEAAAPGQGCQGQGQGQGQGGPPFPPARRSPPPPPPWAGRAGTGAQQSDKGGQGSTWGRPSAAPLAAQGHGSPSAGPRRGAVEPGLHSAGAAIGRGGRPTPHSRTCGRGRGSARPEIWAGSLLGGSHVGWGPRSFHRATIRWVGQGG